MKKIVFTGGGSAGHVTPNLALMDVFLKENWEIHYIGTKDGIEKELISKIKEIKYHEISAGKLRRYISKENLKDPFKVLKGVLEAKKIIRDLKPDVIFSKGGFVSVPVVMGAWFNRIPAVIHECDYTPGLANKIAIPFAKKICVTFPDTLKYIKGKKGVFTGTPIRKELFLGKKEEGLKICGFNSNKPIIMVVGGSLGAGSVNVAIRNIVKQLTTKYQIIHLCGRDKIDKNLDKVDGYKQYEYLNEELPHVLSAADLVISRAGANSIFELLSLNKPNILIPLPLSSSRGDQILNAKYFETQGFSKVLMQEEVNDSTLLESINYVYDNREGFIENMKKGSSKNSVKEIVDIIKSVSK